MDNAHDSGNKAKKQGEAMAGILNWVEEADQPKKSMNRRSDDGE